MPQLTGAHVHEMFSHLMGGQNHAVLLLVLGVVGVLSLLFGYRLVKLFVFLGGFVIGALVGYAVNDSSVLHAVVFGVISGAVALLLWYLGIFLIGAVCGVLLAAYLEIRTTEVVWTFAIIGGILAIVVMKFMVIVFTSWTGASILAPIISYMFRITNARVELVCTIVLAVLGIIFQYGTAPAAKPGRGTGGGEPREQIASDEAQPAE